MDADPGYNSQADDQVDADMEQAQLRLEQLRKEKEEVENSRRRLEECHMRKARFMDQQMSWATAWSTLQTSSAGKWKASARKAMNWNKSTWR